MDETKLIKERMGDEAYNIIVLDLKPKKQGVFISCPQPNHPDNHPSAEWKGDAFHCYSCGMQYDIFDHYDITYHKPFREALQELASKYRIDLSDYIFSQADDLRVKRTFDLTNYLPKERVATSFFGPSYLTERGIDEEVAKSYAVGYTDTEILFRHCERIHGRWKEICCKRRNLDKTMYEMENGPVKEIQVKNGNGCFFGIHKIFSELVKPYVIITEGHIDCLRLATSIQDAGLSDLYAVISLPNGSGSLKQAMENSPSFINYYRSDNCKGVFLLPDNDLAGGKLVEIAGGLLKKDKCKYIWLGDIEDIKEGTDISDILALGYDVESVLEMQKYFPVDGVVNAKDVGSYEFNHGVWTGFATWDYNDSGLRPGCITVLTGSRGQGKTTLARQVAVNIARIGYKSFCYLGESTPAQERDKFARNMADVGEINTIDNGAGRTIYIPQDIAREKFDKAYGESIAFYSPDIASIIKSRRNLFDDCLEKMIKKAKRETYLFIIDSLMMLTNNVRETTSEQKRIMQNLTEFVKKYQGHVIMIAHPRKGEGDQSCSGASEIENLADTIIRYKRGPSAHENLSEWDNSTISARLIFEKVREEGTDHQMLMKWNGVKGIVEDVVYIPEALPNAKRLYEEGFPSRLGKTGREELMDEVEKEARNIK